MKEGEEEVLVKSIDINTMNFSKENIENSISKKRKSAGTDGLEEEL